MLAATIRQLPYGPIQESAGLCIVGCKSAAAAPFTAFCYGSCKVGRGCPRGADLRFRRPKSDGHLASLERQCNQLSDAVHVQFCHDVFAMLADGADTQIELACDVLAGVTLAKQADDLAFALGEHRQRRRLQPPGATPQTTRRRIRLRSGRRCAGY